MGVVLFRLVFKAYPFSPSSYEDEASKDPHFVEKFIESERNTYKVKISESLKELLQGMLQYRPEDRLSFK